MPRMLPSISPKTTSRAWLPMTVVAGQQAQGQTVPSATACGKQVLMNVCLGHYRLDEALETFRKNEAFQDVKFTVKFFPYQLYPDFSQDSEDRYERYKRTKYNNDAAKMKMYTDAMSELGRTAALYLTSQGKSPTRPTPTARFSTSRRNEVPRLRMTSLTYHPSHPNTLLTACLHSGTPPGQVQIFLTNPSLFTAETKALIREQRSNGIDSVPMIMVEGKRRDFTLIGAKEVNEYVKVLESVAKESR